MAKKPKGKARIDFTGFLDYARQLDQLDENLLKKAVQNSLEKTKDYLNNETLKAMESSKYNFEVEGESIKSLFKIEDKPVEWNGYIAKAFVGVDLSEAPQALILAVEGTPHQAADKNIYNAMKGKGKYKKEVEKIQENEFYKILKEGLDG